MAAASDIRPALRSIFFYYRIPRGAGNVLVMAQLLDTVTNSTVGRSSLITLKASGFEFVFTPVCIQLSSDRRQSFDSRIQLQVTVPSDTTYEMRRLETSKTDACRGEILNSLLGKITSFLFSKKRQMSGGFRLRSYSLWTVLSARRKLS